MDALKGALLRLKGLVGGDRIEREMEDELRFHLEMEAEKEARRGVGAMALGATRAGVLRDVVGEGLRLAGVGVIVGVAGALVVTRALRSVALEFTSPEPPIYALVILAVLTATATASLAPALRASGADPAATLRTE